MDTRRQPRRGQRAGILRAALQQATKLWWPPRSSPPRNGLDDVRRDMQTEPVLRRARGTRGDMLVAAMLQWRASRPPVKCPRLPSRSDSETSSDVSADEICRHSGISDVSADEIRRSSSAIMSCDFGDSDFPPNFGLGIPASEALLGAKHHGCADRDMPAKSWSA